MASNETENDYEWRTGKSLECIITALALWGRGKPQERHVVSNLPGHKFRPLLLHQVVWCERTEKY